MKCWIGSAGSGGCRSVAHDVVNAQRVISRPTAAATVVVSSPSGSRLMDGRVSSVVMATVILLVVLRFGRRQRFPDAIRQLVRDTQDKRQQTGSEHHTHLRFLFSTVFKWKCVLCVYVWLCVGACR